MNIRHQLGRLLNTTLSVVLLWVLVSAPLKADTPDSGTEEIRIGIPGYYPLGWINDKEKVVGVVPQYFETLFADSEEIPRLRYVLCAIDRCRHLMLTGRLDMSVDRIEPRLNERLINIGKVQSLTVERWALKGTDTDPKSVAVTASTARRINIKGEHIHHFSTPHNFIKMLKHGRVDAVISFGVTLELLASNFNLGRDDFEIQVLERENVFFWLSPHSRLSEKVSELEAAVSTIFSNENYDQVFNKHIRNLSNESYNH